MPITRQSSGKFAMGPGASRDNYSGPEDSEVLQAAFNQAYKSYSDSVGKVSISNLLTAFDGDKSKLAHTLADETGTKYKSQLENIRRWTNYEQGIRGAQARNPANSKTASKLKDLYLQQVPPSDMSISIRGMIGYDNDFRPRTVEMGSGTLTHVDTRAFVEAMQAGDTHTAYNVVFAGYAGLTVAEAYNIDLSFS